MVANIASLPSTVTLLTGASRNPRRDLVLLVALLGAGLLDVLLDGAGDCPGGGP
jgi:hypothetical protein